MGFARSWEPKHTYRWCAYGCACNITRETVVLESEASLEGDFQHYNEGATTIIDHENITEFQCIENYVPTTQKTQN